MKMNQKKQEEIFGTVEKVEKETDYTGLKTRTAEVIVDNVDREISVNVDITSMLGETPRTAYSGYLGAQTRKIAIQALENIDVEKERAETAEEELKDSIEDVAFKHELDTNYVEDQIKQEKERAVAAETQLQLNIDNLTAVTQSDKLELSQSISRVSSKVDTVESTLQKKIQQVAEELHNEDASIKQNLSELQSHVVQEDESLRTAIRQIEDNYAEKTYVYEKLVEFTKLSKQIVDSVDTENNKVVKGSELLDPVEGVLYLVKQFESSGPDIYSEYTTIEGVLTLIGDTSINLTGYATEEWVEDKQYLTQQDAATDYAKVTYVDNIVDNLKKFVSDSIEKIDLTDYITESELAQMLNSIEFIDGGTSSSLNI